MDAPSASLAASLSDVTKTLDTGLRILIVDNDRSAACTLERELTCQTKPVISTIKCVKHGLDALIVAEELQPQLVVIETGWPRRSGACTAKLVRSRHWGKRSVIVSHRRGLSDDQQPSNDFDFHFFEGFSCQLLMQIYPSLAKRRWASTDSAQSVVPASKQRATCASLT